jgi:ABC-type glutathione transport system ATPase component
MESLILHYKTPKAEAEKRAIELLDMVGHPRPGEAG